jgi:hypothetical protein
MRVELFFGADDKIERQEIKIFRREKKEKRNGKERQMVRVDGVHIITTALGKSSGSGVA